MPSLTPSSLRIGISRSGISVVRRQGWLRRRMDVIGQSPTLDSPHDVAQSAALLDDILAAGRYRRLPATVTLADDFVRLFMVTPPLNTSRLEDCSAAADVRFQSLYGERPNDWKISADWDLRKPFLACALPSAVVDAILRVCAEHGLILMEMVPHFVAAWNRYSAALKPGAWFAVVHNRNLTMAAIEGRRLVATRAMAIPEDPGSRLRWVREELRREGLRLNLAMPPRLQFCGDLHTQQPLQAEGEFVFERLDAEQGGRTGPLQPAGVALACAGVR